jgi:hypothetical protein
VGFALLVATLFSMSLANFFLWLGNKRGWLDLPVDPVPGRSFLRSLYRRLHDRTGREDGDG